MSADQTRRIWQSEACPDWCRRPHGHLDAPTNRACSSEPVPPPEVPEGVRLSLAQAEGDGDGGAYLTSVDVVLEQSPREVEPRVLLSSRQHGVIDMTLEEASSLRALIGEVLATAERAMKEGDR